MALCAWQLVFRASKPEPQMENAMRDILRHYIDGDWVPSFGDATQDIINPATRQESGRLGLGTPVDVERAVAAARRTTARPTVIAMKSKKPASRWRTRWALICKCMRLSPREQKTNHRLFPWVRSMILRSSLDGSGGRRRPPGPRLSVRRPWPHRTTLDHSPCVRRPQKQLPILRGGPPTRMVCLTSTPKGECGADVGGDFKKRSV